MAAVQLADHTSFNFANLPCILYCESCWHFCSYFSKKQKYQGAAPLDVPAVGKGTGGATVGQISDNMNILWFGSFLAHANGGCATNPTNA